MNIRKIDQRHLDAARELELQSKRLRRQARFWYATGDASVGELTKKHCKGRSLGLDIAASDLMMRARVIRRAARVSAKSTSRK
jgi:hypothetical protein